MARPLWSGSISFGLVNVPVNAFTAVRDHDVHFHQVDKKFGARIRHRNVMAGQLIDGLAADWNPDKYHDTYVEELRKRIKAKKAGKEIVDETVTSETPANVVDLVATLQASLDKAKRPRKARKRAKKSA